MPINPVSLHEKYATSAEALRIVLSHCQAVTDKALRIAQKFPEVDVDFIYEAAMLHDIGVYFVQAPKIFCFGEQPYLAHIIIGSHILQKEGLPKHAKVAETHTGVGITKEDVISKKLPIPAKNYIPTTLEEKIISYADLFFSKSNIDNLYQETSFEDVESELIKHGQEKLIIFAEWQKMFE